MFRDFEQPDVKIGCVAGFRLGPRVEKKQNTMNEWRAVQIKSFRCSKWAISGALLGQWIGLSTVIALIVACNPAPNPVAALPLAKNRAFSGAPPTIVHEVKSLGRENCLSCHLAGEAALDNGKKPKKTPHPELTRCRQCHVAQIAKSTYKKSGFVGQTYTLRNRSQSMGPWLIPHPLTLRENCLGCHGVESAQPQLTTDHPERTRCIQCHLPMDATAPGPRHDLAQPENRGDSPWRWSL